MELVEIAELILQLMKSRYKETEYHIFAMPHFAAMLRQTKPSDVGIDPIRIADLFELAARYSPLYY